MKKDSSLVKVKIGGKETDSQKILDTLKEINSKPGGRIPSYIARPIASGDELTCPSAKNDTPQAVGDELTCTEDEMIQIPHEVTDGDFIYRELPTEYDPTQSTPVQTPPVAGTVSSPVPTIMVVPVGSPVPKFSGSLSTSFR